MREYKIKQPKPDTKKYNDLFSEIEKGIIQVPKFQRDFVWDLDKTTALLDSMLKGYPIGTFIFWETSEKLNSIKKIGDIDLPSPPEDKYINYVLDGQQRITSLYAAYEGVHILKGDKKKIDYKKIYVDLEADITNSDNQIVVSEKPSGKYIILHDILRFDQKNFSDLLEKYGREYLQKISEYYQAFSSYDFSTITLRKEDIDSAIEVFTRINTGGKVLTLFEIMSAKTYDEEQNFDMQKIFEELLVELRDINYGDIPSSIILQTLSTLLDNNKECKRKVILKLNKQEIINIWEDVIDAIKLSIDYFRSTYRITASALLPYPSLIVPFAYFCYHNPNIPNGKESKLLEEFFWRMSLSYRYSSTTESKITQDVKRMDMILNGERPSYKDIDVRLSSPEDLVEIPFTTGNSYCKAILCLLAYQRPKCFLSDSDVILDNSWLKISTSKNYHHFFPKGLDNIENLNSIVNITLVSDILNKKEIGMKYPSVYIKEFMQKNPSLEKSLKDTHLIDDIKSFGIEDDDYNLFLKERSNRIFNELKNKIGESLD